MEWSELQYVCVGLFGVLLLVSGTRLYRYSIVAPGAGVGAYVGVVLTMGQSESIQLLGVGVCAVVGVVTMLLVEKLAIALLCALMGGAIVQYAVPYYLGVPIEWYWVIVGSVVGNTFYASVSKITSGMDVDGWCWMHHLGYSSAEKCRMVCCLDDLGYSHSSSSLVQVSPI